MAKGQVALAPLDLSRNTSSGSISSSNSGVTSPILKGGGGTPMPPPVSRFSLARLRKPSVAEKELKVCKQIGKKLGVEHWSVARSDVSLGKKIDEGAYGTVMSCTISGYEESAVAKHINLARLKSNDLPLVRSEVQIWARLDHRNCLQLLGFVFTPDEYLLLCEHMQGGNLFASHRQAFRAQAKPLPPHVVASRMHDIASGLHHLHTIDVMHRDVKSTNVLIAADGRLVLADFGLARVVSRAPTGEPREMTAETGSYRWMAPEVFLHEPYRGSTYDLACDVYSFAMLSWEMVSFTTPFQGMSPFEVAAAAANSGVRPKVPSHVPAELASVIQACWQHQPSRRPRLSQTMEVLHPLLAPPSPAAAPATAASDSGDALHSRTSSLPSTSNDEHQPRPLPLAIGASPTVKRRVSKMDINVSAGIETWAEAEGGAGHRNSGSSVVASSAAEAAIEGNGGNGAGESSSGGRGGQPSMKRPKSISSGLDELNFM